MDWKKEILTGPLADTVAPFVADGNDGGVVATLNAKTVDTIGNIDGESFRGWAAKTGIRADIEDVAQETFIKAYRALPNFRGDSAFYTWLYRIAINTAKNHLISRSRKPQGIDAEIEEAEQFDSAIGLRDIETPEIHAHIEQLEKCIRDSIGSLSDELKAAITLREFEGLSYEEIAEVLECPVGTVRSRIFRAREAIDKQMKPLLDYSD